jgi:MFS family permease
MLAVLRHRNFALLWLGQVFSQIGDMVLIIALPFYVYQLTGSLLQTGLIYIVETLPRILLGSLAGVFVDRWDRRWTMIAADLGRAGGLLLLLLVRSPSDLWLLYTVACVQSIVSLFFAPAISATTPMLVAEQHLVAANALHSLSESLMRFIGPPLGGALLALAGLTGVVFVDSVSFVFSATMILLIVVPEAGQNGIDPPSTRRPKCANGFRQETRDERQEHIVSRLSSLVSRLLSQTVALFRSSCTGVSPIGARWVQIWQECLDGMRLVRERPVLLAIFITFGIFALSGGLSAAPLVVFVREVMGGSALTLGWMAMAQGAGSMLGAALIGRASASVRPAYLVGAPLAIAGCIVLLFVNIPVLAVAVPLIALMGVFIVGFFVTTQTLVQLNVADQYRGRIASTLGTTTSVMGLLGMLVASTLGDRVGAVGLLDASACLNILAGYVAMMLLRDAKIHRAQPVTEQEPAYPPLAAEV